MKAIPESNALIGEQIPAMPKTKLSTKEQALLLLIHLKTPTEFIPDECWSSEGRDTLLRMGLIEPIDMPLTGQIDDESYQEYATTSKGDAVITQGEYIVVYPLASDSGTATSYNDTLMSMSDNAIRALGAALIGTKSNMRMGPHLNIRLADLFDSSVKYYATNRKNPMSVIHAFEQRERVAAGEKNVIIDMTFDSIAEFYLSKPILYYVPPDIDPETTDVTKKIQMVHLVKVLNPNEILCSNGVVLDRRQTAITSEIKMEILKQYFDGLSRFNNPTLNTSSSSNKRRTHEDINEDGNEDINEDATPIS